MYNLILLLMTQWKKIKLLHFTSFNFEVSFSFGEFYRGMKNRTNLFE